MHKLAQLAIVLAVVIVVAISVTVPAYLATHQKKVFTASAEDKAVAEGTVEYSKNEGGIPYLIKRDGEGNVLDEFKIISTTDTHMRTHPATDLQFKILDKMLKTEKPDLLVFVGDNVLTSIEDTTAFERLGDFLEERGQYWAYALGNHDGQDDENGRTRIVEFFGRYPHCLVQTEDKGIWGDGNSAINILGSGGKILQTVFLIDSGENTYQKDCDTYGSEYKKGYDAVKPDQINWYAETLTEIAADNDGVTPKSLVFMHIPLQEFNAAYSEAVGTDKLLYGAKKEKVCSSPLNYGFFDKMLELGSTQAVVSGHDHTNDFCAEYKSIKLLYSQSLSYPGYSVRGRRFDRLMYGLNKKYNYFNEGCTDFIIRADGRADIMPVVFQHEENFLEEFRADYKVLGWAWTLPKNR